MAQITTYNHHMKITHLLFSLRTGGTENMLIDIINEQVLFAEVNLYIVNDDITESILSRLSKKANVKRFRRKSGSRNPLPLFLLNIALLKACSHIIHCHNQNMIELLLPFFHRKTVLTIHDMLQRPVNFSKYRKCFAISRAVEESVLTHAKTHCTVIQNGILFSSIKCKDKANREDGVFRILQISRLNHHKKGQHIAIGALELLKNSGITGIQLDFIGEGDSADFLKQLAAEKQVSEQIRFLGLKDRTYVYDHLQLYDLLIQPSLYEGFGLTVVEGMAAKVPVLVSAIEGPLEIIAEGKYGYRFEKENITDLANSIREIMIKDIQQTQKAVECARAYARKQFDIRNTALNYLEEYQTYA